MTESFGTRLRTLRMAAGMSMGELARRINYSKSHVSKIENGIKRPNLMLAKLCDVALETGGALTALVPATEKADIRPTGDERVWVMELDESGELRFDQTSRRHVLAGAGTMLGFALHRGARPAVDEQVVAGLRSSFDQLRALGRIVGPAVVLGQVIALVHTMRTLAADDDPEPGRSELLLLAARGAEYAGWLSQELDNDRAALWWTDRAVGFAAAAGDRDLANYALVRRAELALYRQDAIGTVSLARQAQADPDITPRVLGLAARCEAQGHALAGDQDGCQSALDRAAGFLAVEDPDGAAALGSTSVPNELDLARGWALFDLGRPGHAAEVLDHAVAQIPDSARRARARFGARRALAYAQNGDVDRACVLAGQVLDDTAHVDSATVRQDLRQLARLLARWRDVESVREIYPTLTAALHTAAPS